MQFNETTTIRGLLSVMLINELKSREHTMSPEDVEICIGAAARIAELTIIKFVAGSIKHGGCILDRNMMDEAVYEVIDLNIYLYAEEYKRQVTSLPPF